MQAVTNMMTRSIKIINGMTKQIKIIIEKLRNYTRRKVTKNSTV